MEQSPAERTPRKSPTVEEERPSKRQKRDKYTAVACNECKKRKIKCNGEAICQRCFQIGTACVYNAGGTDPSPNTISRLNDLDIKFKHLQRQVDDLQYQLRKSVDEAKSSSDGVRFDEPEFGTIPAQANPPRPRQRFSKEAQFAGPSSAQYGLDVGKSSLKSIGVQPEDGLDTTVPNSAFNTRPSTPTPRIGPGDSSSIDPLNRICYEEGIRLISYYEEELYPIYPIINAAHVEEVAKYLLHGHHVNSNSFPEATYDDRDIDILRMTIATALILEGQGQNEAAEEMAATVQGNVSRRSWNVPVSVKDVTIMAMMSIYFFQCDEELMAWRAIGQAVRLALEMGMHRHKSLLKAFPDQTERQRAIKLFWATYVLDQRWSLGAGLPCALNQADIDPDLPEPEDPSPYNRSILSYARLSSKVMKAVDNSTNLTPKERREEAGYLDFQLQQWQQSIPPELHLIHPSAGEVADHQPRNIQRLRALLYARCNHLRIVNRRCYLLSARRIAGNPEDAQFVVDTAKDTIQVLAHLNRTSTIYQKQQSLFNYFLITALTALFLAVCHGPNHFSTASRPEFILALDLIKNFSTKSLVSRRLWKAVREIRLLAPKIGLGPRANNATTNGSHAFHEARDVEAASDVAGRTEKMGAILANTMVPSAQAWDMGIGWSPGEDLSWLGGDELEGTTIGNQMSYAFTDLYDVMGGWKDGPSAD